MKREELVESIFSKNSIFEREILDVHNDRDRSEVMHILIINMLENTLKEHLNFIYIKDLSDFTLKPIVNILFKEIANEWIAYAEEVLFFSKREALEVLQRRDRVNFLHALVDSYYKNYQDYIYEAIAHSFVSLLASMDQASPKVMLVNNVINSELIANRSVLGINSFNQLYQRIITAKNLKAMEISKIQIKLSKIRREIDSNTTDKKRKEALTTVVQRYEEKNEKMLHSKLDTFDSTLHRVVRAIYDALKNGFTSF